MIIFIFFTTLNASSIDITNNSKISVLEKSEFYIDKSSKLDIKDIVKKDFKKSQTNYFKLSYTKDNLWIKFKLENPTDKHLDKYLTLTNPILDEITLYENIKGNFVKKEIGRSYIQRNSVEDLVYPSFEISIDKNETKEFYLKTHSISSANYFQLFIKDQKQTYKDDFSYQLVETLFFGAMLALIIYNIFIYIFTRDKAYLFYIFHIFFITLNHLSYSGMSSILFEDNTYKFDTNMNVYYISFAIVFILLFVQSFLHLKNFKRLNIITNIFIGSILVLALISNNSNYLMDILSLVVLIATLYILFLSIYLYTKKIPQAKYILIGWSINIIGIFMITFKQHGVETPFDSFTYFYETTTFLEAILFSIALVSKLNKTKELEVSLNRNKSLLKELNHRVKNNMQFIIILYRLKLENLITPKIDNKLYEIENSIQSMSRLHEALYQQEDVEDVETKEYFLSVIEKLKLTFEIEHKIDVQINSSLSVEQSIYCGIILNELITNSIKYAFNNEKGIIKITLNKEDNKNVLEIEDNGAGFDYNEKISQSFGLTFIEALVEDELKGKINFFNKNGTKVIIIF